MKKDTVTITCAEYAHLNKAANAAVEHALELVQAARLVDELQARINELNKERDDMTAYANVKEDEIVVLTIQNQKLKAERDALKEEVERCEASIRFWKKGACDLLQELEER